MKKTLHTNKKTNLDISKIFNLLAEVEEGLQFLNNSPNQDANNQVLKIYTKGQKKAYLDTLSAFGYKDKEINDKIVELLKKD